MDYEIAENKIKEILTSSADVLKDVVDFLHDNFNHYSWVSIYLVDENELVLGPWKGPHATEHIRIPIGQGICGSAAESGKTEIIPDAGHDLTIVQAELVNAKLVNFLMGINPTDAPGPIASIGIFCLAYQVGYLTLFAPGGFGPRELVMGALLTPYFGPIAPAIAIWI